MRISDSKTHFVTDSGHPFLWIADTAWNIALRGNQSQWETYLSRRKAQGFTVIQFVTMPWHGCTKPAGGLPYTIENGQVLFHEEAWKYLDDWFACIRDHGLCPAPVMLWSLLPESPGRKLSTGQAIEICRRQLERWNSSDTFWLLTGDAELRSPALVERWKSIGREVFQSNPDTMISLHTSGKSWAVDLFADEPWYTFGSIQSGHGVGKADLNFLVSGPFSHRWQSLKLPILNLEPCYEFAKPFDTTRFFTRKEIRRALIWSLLLVPTAGVTYGNNSIWVFAQSEEEEAEGHGPHWMATHWRNGLQTEGIEDLNRFAEMLKLLPWQDLRPANHFLYEQPGFESPERTAVVSATEGLNLIIAYLPEGGKLSFSGIALETATYDMHWWNPADGSRLAAEASIESFSAIEESCYTIEAPDSGDWIFLANS